MVEEFTPFHDFKNDLSIYPNPSQNELNIQIDNDEPIGWAFYIVDVNGLIVIQENVTVINISGLANGSYTIYAVKEREYLNGVQFIKQ